MTKRLATRVAVRDGRSAVWLEAGTPASKISREHRDQLGDHVWVDDSEQSAEPPEGTGEPPRTGKGSGKAAWAAYAASVGVTVPDDASRDDIIAAVDARG